MTTMSKQLVVYYRRGDETVVYDSAYDHAQANLSKARCEARYPNVAAHVIAADKLPPGR